MFSLRRLPAHTIAVPSTRLFSSSLPLNANRALIYSQTGSPSSVLSSRTYPNLPPPPPNTLNLRLLLAPINPSDINVIEGVYPAKPAPASFPGDPSLSKSESGEDVFVSGNEGLAEVVESGEQGQGEGEGKGEGERFEKGEWVILTRPQSGTWRSGVNVGVEDVVRIGREEGLSEVHAATITVNYPTAYNMLRDYVDLKEGDWIIQNGANSAVGQAVIQIAKSRGLNTINLIRARFTEALKAELTALGATHVLTYTDLSSPSTKSLIKSWTSSSSQGIKLALNCVSGKPTSLMARLLGPDAHLVSYGAMSKEPLSLPTSLFIFKGLTCHGFWQSRWYKEKGRGEREGLIRELVGLILGEPKHEIVTLKKEYGDEEATGIVREVMRKMAEGKYGKKVLLRVEEPDD
ncbi:trans-2-enoyl-CoA reductase [Stereum hirsutum FP-91666 SS1]|uniref:trans-2-enoyl-CoA reductase n=1 Tax=Stereum hirsutum (strain FP-91666) TaxID=721885 RepID=UPI000440C1F0|nr:trans-2-enoyl-CoA reductase [Stereum hirsutum FP-91666 SS1]EIM86660.1 trans-2-enoyl-CoA reductase [Stereum hirsutum FP-91666 SS1]